MTMFDKKTKNMICRRLKKVTRRLYNPDYPRRPAVPTAESGNYHKIKINRTPKVYGELNILACYTSTLGAMTEEDAKLEGFNSLREYKEYFYQVNGYIDDNEIIWVIEFEPVWTNPDGIILQEE